ncbi:AzlD domain-containing protein [Erwinia tracheiphila]|uniref:AzlD domain-containing protein n=1 Tax=Erwinia tracheiphila TaxID=65700 RepID=A0A0M2KIL6_9GAMM|nr:AzlD domain-containing protein [Erwinia tracheiphila]AXF78131.1 AzlD domain-containing protein [Erwinia tracheiphila]EOS94571.1 membrane protein [Erwinia tracheiphila PSU-1]KKF36856.1 hypothetical protein SY86_17785 [Erwinia tracheiphila]UIA83155.1 AzlD domain-containing protein [Erwinia tracheiphila]UIA88191.1 AzlD domain-containing protein [Erwinia tracheiphila]
MSSEQMWIAVMAMGGIIWLLRCLPFMFNKSKCKTEDTAGHKSTIFKALGPSLLAAIMVVTLIPGIQRAVTGGYGRMLCYGAGIVITMVVLRVTRNPGVAVICGVAIYGAGLWFLTL